MQRIPVVIAATFAAMLLATAELLALPAPPRTGWGEMPAHALQVHGRHCGWRGGHRHPSACDRNRHNAGPYGSTPRPRVYRSERRPGYYRYPQYPSWADRTFTEADERGVR